MECFLKLGVDPNLFLIGGITFALFCLIFISTDTRARRILDRAPLSVFYTKYFAGRSLTVRWVIFIIFVAAMGLREPTLLFQPRFWAEEGTTWFAFGSTHSVAKTLLMVNHTSSYFNLIANIGAVLSSLTAVLLGLTYAPAATTFLAFSVQAVAIALIVFGKSRIFDALWKVVIGCGVVLFTVTSTDEIWLNSINSMSFLGLIAFLLAFEEIWTWPRRLQWLSIATLALCGLSSPYSLALLPVFAIMLWHDRKRQQKIQCLVLLGCLVIQGCVVLHVQRITRSDPRSPAVFKRGSSFRFDRSAIIIFLGQMVDPAVGPEVRDSLEDALDLKPAWMWASGSSDLSVSPGRSAWVCCLLATATLWFLKSRRLYSTTNLVLASFLMFAIFTGVAALGGIALARYAFLPGVTFGLLLLLNCERSDSSILRICCAAILSLGLAEGMVQYTTVRTQWGPPWRQEVAAWNKDHSYPLHIWPVGWGPFIYREHQHRH